MSDRLFFGNYTALWRDVLGLIPRLPAVDAVVGVPRSGMLPATMLAVALHVPLAQVEDNGELLTRAGSRLCETGTAWDHVLVIDDACYHGAFVERYRALREHHDVTTACVYGGPETHKRVDVVGRVAERPRVFSWNLLNNSLAKSFCCDLDGVLCRDPSEAENDDGEAYREFVRTAEPLLRAQFPLHAIVTSRLEKWRSETEAWLRKHEIEYEHLVMAPYAGKAERQRANRYADDKADYYAATSCHAFIESSYRQALHIAELTGRAVICPTTDTGFNVRCPRFGGS